MKLAALAVLLAGCAGAASLAPLRPDVQEDIGGARWLAPLTRAHRVPVDAHRSWIVTELEPDGHGSWSARRAGRTVSIEDGPARSAAERFYLLGTDGLGRDLLSRVLHGLRHSIVIGLAAVALSLALGVAIGAAAGLAGGALDSLLMRAVDVFLSFPRLVVFLLLFTFVPPSAPLLVVVLGATTWPGLARLVRAEVLALRESGLVQAARSTGAAPRRVLARHVLPQLGSLIGVTAALRFADTVALESALSFLGLGAPPPAVSLGGVLASGRDALAQAWWVALAPGVVLVGLVLSLRSAASRLTRSGEPPSVV